ncbi:MAG TPA: ATP-binding cassette domain-containing protein [Spirochaetota bacterium]|nr:ATP-binding cassette domain-containing protein [Spirochaetota bacterium]HPC40781.1 ATP-binding cassette domain-containing protein [Spirochaetota bacterium]HQF10361.1 ATP-binding cassette domain-containing protein [Spirochaetota bacterium]HQH99234.1 ATP-binding cassette domain-containing protein [Spirochaetota bacterium]HQJ71031.1 ATP-binding cassette domain-containing protein [Spirochaetota bacterium]
MISVKELRIAFDGRTIVDGIDFFVPEGATLILMGKNGSGKSVILKALSGLIDYSGTIEINGVDIRDLYRERHRSDSNTSQRIRIAYVFQKGGLFDSMNVFDNVAFGLRRMDVGEEAIETLVLNSLARVGLRGSEGKLISELSGGMQKRVGLARAICLNPNIIFFDDPTAGLDPILSDSIADLILEIKQSLKTTSIVVTHDATIARKVADSIALLYNGKIVWEGESGAFFSGSDSYARQFLEGDIEGPIDIF